MKASRSNHVDRTHTSSGGLPEPHQVIDVVADIVQDSETRMPPGMPISIQRLMATLGVRVRFDERIPGKYTAKQ